MITWRHDIAVGDKTRAPGGPFWRAALEGGCQICNWIMTSFFFVSLGVCSYFLFALGLGS